MRRKQHHQVTLSIHLWLMNGEKGFGFCFVETESHAAQAGPKLIMESRKILKLFQILSLIVGLQACPITLAHFIIFHVCILGGVSMRMIHTWRPEDNCPKSVLPSLMWVLELNSSQAWHLAAPTPLKFYFKNTVYNFSENPLRLKHNCQALFSNSFFFKFYFFEQLLT